MNSNDKNKLRKQPAIQALLARLDLTLESETDDEDIGQWNEAKLDAYLAERNIDGNQAYREFIAKTKELAITDFEFNAPQQDIERYLKFSIILKCRLDEKRHLTLTLDRTDLTGAGELEQFVDGKIDITSIRFNEQSIQFEEGIAYLSDTQIRQIAQKIDLPEPWLSWGKSGVMLDTHQLADKLRSIRSQVKQVFEALQNRQMPTIYKDLFFSKKENNLLADCFNNGLFTPFSYADRPAMPLRMRSGEKTDTSFLLIERVALNDPAGALLKFTWDKQHPEKEPKIKVMINNQLLDLSLQWEPSWFSDASLLRLCRTSIDFDWLYTWFWDHRNNQLLIVFQSDQD